MSSVLKMTKGKLMRGKEIMIVKMEIEDIDITSEVIEVIFQGHLDFLMRKKSKEGIKTI